MKKYIIFLLLLVVTSVTKSQELTKVIQAYNIKNTDGNNYVEYSLNYSIMNNREDTLVLMFTEDNISQLSINKLIKRKIYRPYGDFSLSMFLYDNIINESKYIQFPQFFIKTILPNEEFKVSIIATNCDIDKINNQFLEHLLYCDLKCIESKFLFPNFMHSVKRFNLEYPYSSIIIRWENLYNFINKKTR